MLEYSKEIVNGARLVAKCLNIRHILIGIEENKPDAIKAMSDAANGDRIIRVRVLKVKYPQGGEKQLINALTHRRVPGGKLPADVGCLVFNVETCRSIWNAFSTGMPVIERVVTVSGPQAAVIKNLKVKLGTPVAKLFEHCAGFITEPKKIIVGGPMMGVAQYTTEIPVTKGVSSVLAFGEEDISTSKAGSCIRCGRCVEVCPMNLMPLFLDARTRKGDYDACEKLSAQDCIECGCCSYVCPAKRLLTQSIRLVKQTIAANKKR
jgi:electron transport complex protein RnfC